MTRETYRKEAKTLTLVDDPASNVLRVESDDIIVRTDLPDNELPLSFGVDFSYAPTLRWRLRTDGWRRAVPPWLVRHHGRRYLVDLTNGTATSERYGWVVESPALHRSLIVKAENAATLVANPDPRLNG